MRTPEVNSQEWWAERGVEQDVRAARPYTRWTTEDLAPVRDAYKSLTPGQLRTVLGWARQSNGLVIHRHSFECVAPDDPRWVYPEVRPDKAVVIKTIWHYHGTPIEEPPRHPRSGKPLPPQHVHGAKSMQRHIARDREPDDHRGLNTDRVHSHRDLAKYLFPPTASGYRLWAHSHEQEWQSRVLSHVPTEEGIATGPGGKPYEREAMFGKEYLRLVAEYEAWEDEHKRRHHHFDGETFDVWPIDGTPPQEFTLSTLHLHKVPAKLSSDQLAKRIDVHPLVWQHGGFEPADCVFFAIEGCIKADAILTALLRAGKPPAVFSVPSVSLWEATYPSAGNIEVRVDDDVVGFAPTESETGDELAAFAHAHLVNKLVCIVPDADAHTKDEVMTQALLCRSTLRRLGARAQILLPPDDRLSDGIKGVDDHLGKGSGALDDMVWYCKESPNEEELDSWLRQRSGTERWKADRRRRGAQTLAALATHAGENGEYSASVRLLVRASGRRRVLPKPEHDESRESTGDPDAARKRFERGIKDLLDIGAITANKPLSVRREKWTRRQSAWRLEQGLHWAEDAVVITVHKEVRAPIERRSAHELYAQT